MIEVVNNPGRQELAQCDTPQCRMIAPPAELLRRDLQLTERLQIGGTHLCERGQHLVQRKTPILLEHSRPIERIERLLLTRLENNTGALDPVDLVAVQQVANDVIDAPGIWSLRARSPLVGQPAEEHR